MSSADTDGTLDAAFAALSESPSVSTHIGRALPATPSSPEVGLLFSKFKEDAPDLESLAEFLSQQVVNYVVPLKKRREVLANALSAPGGADLSEIDRLSKEARRKFIEFDEKNPGRASEIGELLAYLVAIEWLGAFQLASKMALKTSFNMPVHGVDGIHAKFENGVMTLYFLESKLAQTAQAGLADFCSSVEKFGANRKQYLLEYSIIADLGSLDLLSPTDKTLALTYLDIYGSNKSKRIERAVGIVCYTEKMFDQKLPKTSTTTPQMHEDAFATNYANDVDKFAIAFRNALEKHNLDAAECHAWIVAVPDKNRLRKLFSVGIKI